MSQQMFLAPPPPLMPTPESNWFVEVWKKVNALNNNSGSNGNSAGGDSSLFWSFFNPSQQTMITGRTLDITSKTEYDCSAGLQAFLNHCNTNSSTSCVIPPGKYLLKTFIDLRGLKNLNIYAWGVQFVTHAGAVFYVPDLDVIFPGYVFNHLSGGLGTPEIFLGDSTTSNISFYGLEIDFNYINTDNDVMPLHFDIYQSDRVVFYDCKIRKIKSQLFFMSTTNSGFIGGDHGEMCFGSQKKFIAQQDYTGVTGLQDILVKATTFKGWLVQDKRRYQVKIVAPVSGVDQFVWRRQLGGFLNICETDPTKLSNSVVASGLYNLAANATGISLVGAGAVPQNTWGAIAVDLSLTGTIAITPATSNATGYSSADLAYAGLPAVVVGVMRLGAIAVNSATGAFTFGTSNLFTLYANFKTYCDGTQDVFSLWGPWSATPRPCPVGNAGWYAAPADYTTLHYGCQSAQNPLLWDDGTALNDFGQSYDGGANQTYLESIPILSVAWSTNTGHTVGDTWQFRWWETRLAALAMEGEEASGIDPLSIPESDNFLKYFDGPLPPWDLNNLFIGCVNGFRIIGCESQTADIHTVANFEYKYNKSIYTEWVAIAKNVDYIGNIVQNILGVVLQIGTPIENWRIEDNTFRDWAYTPQTDPTNWQWFTAIRFNAGGICNNVNIINNNFICEQRTIAPNRVYSAIMGLASQYPELTISGNKYSEHVIPMYGNSNFVQAGYYGTTSQQSYGQTISGAFTLTNQDSGIQSLVAFNPPLVTNMRTVPGSILTLSGFTNVLNNQTYTVLKENRDQNDAIISIIFSTILASGSTDTFTGIFAPLQIVCLSTDTIYLEINSATIAPVLITSTNMASDFNARVNIHQSLSAPGTWPGWASASSISWSSSYPSQLDSGLTSGQSLTVTMVYYSTISRYTLAWDGGIINIDGSTSSTSINLNASFTQTSGLAIGLSPTTYIEPTANSTAYYYALNYIIVKTGPYNLANGINGSQFVMNINGPGGLGAITNITANFSVSNANNDITATAPVSITSIKSFISLCMLNAHTTLGQYFQFQVRDIAPNGGTCSIQYGVYCMALSGATINWFLYGATGSPPSWLANNLTLGGTDSAPAISLQAGSGLINTIGTVNAAAFTVNGQPLTSNTPSYGINTTPYTIPANQKYANLSVYVGAASTVYLDSVITAAGDYVTIINTSAYNVTVGYSVTNWWMAGPNGTPVYQVPVTVKPNTSMMFIKPTMSTYGEVRAIALGPHAMADHTDYASSPAATQKVAQLYWDSWAVPGHAGVAITNATNNGAGLIRITAPGHGVPTGAPAIIANVGGVTAANGCWYTAYVDVNTFDLQNSVFSGTYTSGGTSQYAKKYTTALNSYADSSYYTMSIANGTIQVLHAADYRLSVMGEMFFLTNSGSWHYALKNGVAIPGGARYILNSAAAYGSQTFAIDRVVTLAVNDTLTLVADCETASTFVYPGRVTFSLTKLT